MSWPPTLDEDTSQRADGEQWRTTYSNARGQTVYVEAVKVNGHVFIAPLGTRLDDWWMVWVRLHG